MPTYNPFTKTAIDRHANIATDTNGKVGLKTSLNNVAYADARFSYALASGQTSGGSGVAASGDCKANVVGWSNNTVDVQLTVPRSWYSGAAVSGIADDMGWMVNPGSTDGFSGGTCFLISWGW